MFMDKNTDVCRLSSYAVGLSDTVLVLMKIWYFITRISVTSEGQYQLFSDVQHSTKEQILALVAKKVEFCLTSQASADSFVEELSSATADADADANAAGDVHTPPQRVVSEAGKMASNPATLLNVNEYARDFMLRDNKKHLRTYVDAAFEAFFNYSPDLQYVIYHGNIVIQDLKTGQSQFDSQWRDGLQQFLQMKHDLGVKNETLETNLMSSKKLFFRYKKGLYGLTGTFGNHANQAFLRKLHDPVTFVCIPGNYAPARLEYPAIRTTSEQAQLADISLACHRETSEGRPVLVICEDIDFAKKVIIMLNSLRVGKLVKAFIFDNGHQEHKICMDCGEIIVATCLLGRGADIELTPHAKHSGGLHVILPFTPDSVRVLLQAFGRCGRKELLGTAQVIDIVTRQQSGDDCAPLVCNSMPHATYMELVYHPEAEEVYFNSLAQSIALIDVQEEVFWEHYLELITGSYQDAELVKRKNVPEIFDADGQMDVDHPVFRAVEERWAIFYRQYKDEPSQLRSRFAAEVGIYADSLQHGSRRAERESCVVSSGLRIRLANLQCRVDADYAAAAGE